MRNDNHGMTQSRCRTRWVFVIVLFVSALMLGAYKWIMSPAFAGAINSERLSRMAQSPQWHDGQFRNTQAQWVNWVNGIKNLVFGQSSPYATPDQPLPVVATDTDALRVPPASGLRVTWFGHSSALLEIEGIRILIDPLWGKRASPVSWMGPKPWYAPPVPLEALRALVDVVLISHDHYDHLDHATIEAMQDWRTVFVVPLGMGELLHRWGIPEARIIELDWWEATQVGDLSIVAAPARHSSGRFMTGIKPLWASFALIGRTQRVWYSGDSGFHDTLDEIGQRLGPFDLTMIESGQYDADWPDDHMGPELAIEAHRRVGGHVMMPVHWGLLTLANHGWTEPVERVLAAAQCHNTAVLTPRPGESVEPAHVHAAERWWPALPWQTAQQAPIVGTQNGSPDERVAMPDCPPAAQ